MGPPRTRFQAAWRTVLSARGAHGADLCRVADMLATLRQYSGTIAGGLAIGAAAGFGGSLLADKNKAVSPPITKIEKFPLERLDKYDAPKQPPAPPPTPPVKRLERWFKRWYDDSGDMSTLGWHLNKPHPVLQKHYNAWMNTKNDEDQRLVLFPLCGASVDLAYLARRGHQVIGVDGVPKALDALLADYGEEVPSGGGLKPGEMRLRVAQPDWKQMKAAEFISTKERKYTPAPFLMAVQGDFLDFNAAAAAKYGFPEFDCAFDRGGIVAVEPSDRPQYAANLASLVKRGGRLLLVTVEHDPTFGPPHNVDEKEVRKLFGKDFEVEMLSREDKMEAEPHWKKRGATRFDEVAYMCRRK